LGVFISNPLPRPRPKTRPQRTVGAVLRTSFLTASRRFEFRHDNLGLLWRGTQPKRKVMGWAPEKERILTPGAQDHCRRFPSPTSGSNRSKCPARRSKWPDLGRFAAGSWQRSASMLRAGALRTIKIPIGSKFLSVWIRTSTRNWMNCSNLRERRCVPARPRRSRSPIRWRSTGHLLTRPDRRPLVSRARGSILYAFALIVGGGVDPVDHGRSRGCVAEPSSCSCRCARR
jgi:hypothetical protein